MLEILLIYALAKRIGAIVRAKGQTAFWYQFLFVVLWFGGEFAGLVVGAILGTMLENGDEAPFVMIYLFALGGAALGAAIAFFIAKNVTPAFPDEFAHREDYSAQEYFGEHRPAVEAAEQVQRPPNDLFRK